MRPQRDSNPRNSLERAGSWAGLDDGDRPEARLISESWSGAQRESLRATCIRRAPGRRRGASPWFSRARGGASWARRAFDEDGEPSRAMAGEGLASSADFSSASSEAGVASVRALEEGRGFAPDGAGASSSFTGGGCDGGEVGPRPMSSAIASRRRGFSALASCRPPVERTLRALRLKGRRPSPSLPRRRARRGDLRSRHSRRDRLHWKGREASW